MARKSLRPQLNQIRAWAREGRTDAWIAHQLDVSTSQLRDFRKRHGLSDEGEGPPSDLDLRDEIEAEIEAEIEEAEAEEDEEEEDEDEGEGPEAEEDEEEGDAARGGRGRAAPSRGRGRAGAGGGGRSRTAAGGGGRGRTGEDEGERPQRRRRRRRGGRGRRKRGPLEGTFDQGEEGYGLWLDPAVKDDPVYSENWAGHRAVRVTIEPDRIVIEREGGDDDEGDGGED